MRKDNIFILFLFLIAISLLTGRIIENIPKEEITMAKRPPIDVAKVKKQLQEAGITPHNAMYWKFIPEE